jgi:hypothetical protein
MTLKIFKKNILGLENGLLFLAIKASSLLMAGLLASSSVLAQGTTAATQNAIAEYPNKPIRIIVPYAPGGGGDAVVRYMSDKLAERLKQPIIIENKPGASGFIGAQMAATAAPDGYTLVMVFDGTVVVAPHLLKAPFNTLTDFAPITKLNDATIVLAVNNKVPAKNFKELVTYAKSLPNPMEFGSTGQGSSTHLAGELLALRTGMKLQHIPYKGGGQAVTDVAAGQIPMIVTVVPTVMAHITAGRLVPIAVSGNTRSLSLPDVQTFTEAGVQDFAVTSWYGLLAPAKTPKPIIDKLQREIAAVMQIPEVRERYLKSSFEPVANKPEEFAVQLKADYERWGQVVKDANVKLD